MRLASAGLTLMTLDNLVLTANGFDQAAYLSNVCPINLMVRDMPTMVITGNGESGFDSGEGA